MHAQVAYKAPVPASTSLICTASLDSLDGRKAWVSAQVLDRPGGTLYATGKALFVIPKVEPESGLVRFGFYWMCFGRMEPP